MTCATDTVTLNTLKHQHDNCAILTIVNCGIYRLICSCIVSLNGNIFQKKNSHIKSGSYVSNMVITILYSTGKSIG